MDEPVRTGLRGRPAKRWKLTKNTRDKVRRQRAKAEKAA
jgi:predicted ArsR family transcriptional regulator